MSHGRDLCVMGDTIAAQLAGGSCGASHLYRRKAPL